MNMEFSKIQPFVRYVHYLPLDNGSNYNETIPYDNRLFFTFHGSGEILVNGVIYSMYKGSILIIPSGVRYRLLTPKSDVTYIAVNFDYTFEHSNKQTPIPPTIVSSYNPLMKLEQVYFNDMTGFNDIVHINNLFKLNGTFLKIYHEYTHRMLYSDCIISNLLGQILFDCARTTYTKDFDSNSEIINQIIDYIKENYNKKITNTIIGNRFNLHPNYISNLIKVFTGMPLHQYVMHTRISFSVEMLSEQNYSISEIAEKCGFLSIYHFSKVFKNINGVPPSKYR